MTSSPSLLQVLYLGVAVVLCECLINTPLDGDSEPMAGVEYLPRQTRGYWGWGYANALLLADGRLMAWYDVGKEWSDEQMDDSELLQQALARYSSDNGYTWSEPVVLFDFPKGKGLYMAELPLLDRDGNIHLFGLHRLVWGKTRHQDNVCYVFHTISGDGGKTWSSLHYCDFGHEFNGDLAAVLQLRSGRIVLPCAYPSERGGWLAVMSLSDDGGKTWRPSQGGARGFYVDEPSCIELQDGRVWMLCRPGSEPYLWELWSSDGGDTWTDPQPSRFVSCSATSHMIRLRDGRMVLVWNNSRAPAGGTGEGQTSDNFHRYALSAAISDDDGNSWHGYREIVRSIGPMGSRGWVVHPWLTETADGAILVSFRQGDAKGPRYLRLQPDWLTETHFRDDFSRGLEHWNTRWTEGPGCVPHPNWANRQVLALRKPKIEKTSGASLNFPFGVQGHLTIKLRREAGFQGARLCLTDYFSWAIYPEPGRFGIELSASGEVSLATDADEFIPTKVTLGTGKWQRLRFDWDCEEGSCGLSVDGQHIADLPQLSRAAGICYLRLWSAAEETDEAGLLVDSITVGVKG